MQDFILGIAVGVMITLFAVLVVVIYFNHFA